MQSRVRTYAQVMVGAFEGVSEKEAGKKVRALKHLLHKRGDFKQISKILQEFSKAWRERRGKIATVVTVERLVEKAKTEMAKSLEKKGYVLEERVDPAVIGGMALYLGNEYVIDSTVKGKLQRMAKMFNLRY